MPGSDQRPDSPISLGLSQPPVPPPDQPLPSVNELQFRRAQPIPSEANPAEKACESCKQPIPNEFYQVQNHVICRKCADKIREGQQAAKPISLVRPAIYGVGAAIIGCLLYGGFQIGLIALAVGWMVGKAVRYGAHGIGGRPQQILAVTLTYFSMTTSFLPGSIVRTITHDIVARSKTKNDPAAATVPTIQQRLSSVPFRALLPKLILWTFVAPFIDFATAPVGALISLFIVLVGLQRAWAMTARHEILVSGPFSCPSP